MNLVNELQVSAEKDDVLTVLRKTKRLASKLDRQDIAEWLQSEQEGYAKDKTVPDYRKVGTSLVYDSNGYLPAGYGMLMRGIQEIPSYGLAQPIWVRDSISTIMSWIDGIKSGAGIFNKVEGTECGALIRKHIRFDPDFEHQIRLMLRLNDSHILAIPEQIKDKVLDWACNLEAAGVTGDGMTFSTEQKQIAHSVTFNLHNCQVDQLNNMGTNQRSDR
jgi:hypothetical protein